MKSGILRIARHFVLALIFLALGVVSLRPICELAFAEHSRGEVAASIAVTDHATAGQQDSGDAPSETCCADLKDGTLVKPAELLALSAQGPSLGAALLLSVGLLLLARPRNPAKIRFAAPPERSFYARSARIQR